MTRLASVIVDTLICFKSFFVICFLSSINFMENANSTSKTALIIASVFSSAVVVFLSISNLANPLEFDTVVFINLVEFLS